MDDRSFIQNIATKLTSLPRAQIFLLFSVLVFLAYANAINHPFVHDDIVFIKENPRIGHLDLGEIFFKESASFGVSAIRNTYWRPLLELTYRLEYKLFGFKPAFYHLVNIVVHLLNAFLLYLLLGKFRSFNKHMPFIIALIFLLHPVQSESVAAIAGISNLLLALFVFSSLLFYFGYVKQGRAVYLLGSLVLFAFALLTKEQAVILPALVILYLFCFARNKLMSASLPLAGFLGVGAAYFLLRWKIAGAFVTSSFRVDAEFWLRIASIPQAILTYIKALILPLDLHYYRSTDVLNPKLIPLLIFCLGIFIIVMILRNDRENGPVYFFGMGWAFITLLPMLNIVPLINEYSLILTADHFLYLPLVGFSIFVVTFCDRYMRVALNFKVAAITLVCVFYLGLTLYYNQFWRSEIALFTRTLRYQPVFGRAQYLLAKAYYFDNQHARALDHFQNALLIMDTYAKKASNDEARKFYLQFVKDIYFDMAHSLEALGEFKWALDGYKRALAIDPTDGRLYNNIGTVYIHLNDFGQAQEFFAQGVVRKPDDIMMKNNLATVLVLTGDKANAIKLYEEILAVEPDNKAARKNRDFLLMEKKEKLK